MIGEIDHVGIAVRSLEEAVIRWRSLLGYKVQAMEDLPERSVRIAMLLKKGSPPVELITPLLSDSAVGRFLEKRGEGIHHICYAVDDIEEAVYALKKKGVEFVGDHPGAGAGGSRTIFIRPGEFNGVLIELKQK